MEASNRYALPSPFIPFLLPFCTWQTVRTGGLAFMHAYTRRQHTRLLFVEVNLCAPRKGADLWDSQPTYG